MHTTLPINTAPSGNYDEEVLHGVRRLLLDRYGAPYSTTGGERLYISRSRSLKRRISNEDEVIAVMSGLGFRIVHAEDHTFEEQVEMASHTTLFVSNHGAGLTNMLFMQTGGNVLELRHETDTINNCYFAMASALGINYYYQTCPSEDSSQDPHCADLRVDPDALGDTIRLILCA